MRNKFNAKRTNGYASKREANHAANLHALQAGGVIENLREQVRFDLLPACKEKGYSRPMYYIADFVFTQDGKEKVQDCKGFRTPVYKIKERLMAQLLGVEIEEV